MFVETDCTIFHEGQDFTAGGAVVDHENGFVFAYLKSSSPPGSLMLDRQHDNGDVQTWHGEKLGTYRVVSSWKNYRGVFSDRVVAVRATIDGRSYHGRSGGSGLFIRLRLCK